MEVCPFIAYIISLFSFLFKKKSNDTIIRKEFVSKTYFELIYNSELRSTNYNETIEIFNKLLSENTELTQPEIKLCKDRVSRNIEREKELFKRDKPFKCRYCKLTRYSMRYCENCIIQYLKSLLGTWKSGSDVIDEFIRECQSKSALPLHIMEWIPFDQFEDIKYLSHGGFAKLYTATWKRGAILDWNEKKQKFVYQGSQKVVLKSLNNSNQPTKVFFDEAKALVNVRSGDIVNAYGVTKFPEDGNYAIVMNFFGDGSLRDYLKKNYETLNLKDKVFAIWRICFALSDIHAQDLIHCDLHSGNILLYTNRCLISDLGLCGPMDDKHVNEVYGIVPYMAPEIFLTGKYSKATDIYSFGTLMWEIFAGNSPFSDIPHDLTLISRIISGERPPMLFVIPDEFQILIKRCWDEDPLKRPTIGEILDDIKLQYKQILENEELSIEYDNKKKTYLPSRQTENQVNYSSRIFIANKVDNNHNILEEFDDENVDWDIELTNKTNDI
ncbi:kinase-like domain-containing protein [Glomus cerebriforme]|uniref:Kinase-like domain-containing protein n=1 Tax=Glomus cerebriforme TaxID=658196 RepID=A0A397T7V4_9GLOM|nr:kinase-like domain-containing protein [Glomus cerebriforme]